MIPLEEIVERASASPSLANVISRLESGEKSFAVSGITGSTKPLLAALLHRALRRPVFLLVADDETALSFFSDLLSLSGSALAIPSRPDEGEPSTETAEYRILALDSLLKGSGNITVASVRSALQKTASPGEFSRLGFEIRTGDRLDRDGLVEALNEGGFERTSTVEAPGEMTIRGGIVDIFPYGRENPIRVEFSGEHVESLREFDPSSQRSIELVQSLRIRPFREPLPQDQSGRSFAPLSEYLRTDTVVIMDEAWLLSSEMEDTSRSESYVDSPFVDELRESYSSVVLSPDAELKVPVTPPKPYHRNIKILKEDIKNLVGEGYAVFVLSETEGQNERMSEILSLTGAALLIGTLSSGFTLRDAGLSVVSEKDIFGREPRRKRRRFKAGIPIESLLTLRPGDIVVHADYGLARFEGIERLNVRGAETDCLLLIYAEGDKIYVPIENMHLVQRYVGSRDTAPKLTKLGTKSWERAKSKVKKAVIDMTRELLDLSAARAAMKGFAFPRDVPWQTELEASFMYDETEDQLRAIKEIKRDMESEKPMDRLICGEVGYGKTEVALRAAFKAVMAEKQVAVLAPTTILAQQHYSTFKDRLEQFPIRCDVISRFRTPREQKVLLNELRSGKVDIVIGTHRLLSDDIEFKSLGLLVIDEEQRFGVRHKEKLKKLRKLVDVLTMSATPIPRTLYMSLLSVKDLSTIETAPRGRLSINTEVSPWDDQLIVDYCLREVGRGGQVYFVHNRVQTIDSMATHIQELVPHLRIGVAHGQMRERELESVMIEFLSGVYDILVTSAIIESGVDIPNVNTMIINRGDRFGLAQLHQLRGRVGRSDRRAHCLILVPKGRSITREARRRLSAILSHTELGSGYMLAMRDLEIRGAGNLLGPEQHGHMQAVGYDLYCQLLAEAVRELKGEPVEKEVFASISLDMDAYIPDSYISESEHKVALYKRLVVLSNAAKLNELENELIDRFGPIPLACMNLLRSVELRILASEIGIRRLSISGRWVELHFQKGFDPSSRSLEGVLSKWTAPVEFLSGRGLKMRIALGEEGPERLRVTKKLLHLLS